MQYDFTTRPDRAGHDALAVDGLGRLPGVPKTPREGFPVIPMWVADMNFVCFPGIQEKVTERVNHPSFGYFMTRDEYYDGIIRWQRERNGVTDLDRKAIGYENGVLGGVISAMNVLCSKGDAVLLHSPTYIGFTGSLTNNGYHIVHSPLVFDEDGIRRMDFADMAAKVEEHHIHTVIFCSPHNPGGRVWEMEELLEFSAFCEKYALTVISDEIWSDIILEGHKHIPLQQVSPYLHSHTVALYAPSKTFNLAGLIGSYHIIYDRRLRERVLKESSLCHYNDMNVLSMYALMGAYSTEGMAWTDQLCARITRNVDIACERLSRVPGVTFSRPQGTYMIFADMSGWCEAKGKTLDDFLAACWDVGVALQDGRPFHGSCHVRINLALPEKYVEEAFDRLEKYVF